MHEKAEDLWALHLEVLVSQGILEENSYNYVQGLDAQLRSEDGRTPGELYTITGFRDLSSQLRDDDRTPGDCIQSLHSGIVLSVEK